MWELRLALLLITFGMQCAPLADASEAGVQLSQGLLAGEATETSVILQARLTRALTPVHADVPGVAGTARFEFATSENFNQSRFTRWLSATEARDFIVKAKVIGLTPQTEYHYRLIYGNDAESLQTSSRRSFRTLGGETSESDVSFVVVTGMNYDAFHYGRPTHGERSLETAYQGSDKPLGYPALATITRMKPNFFVGTGDNVYYDSRDEGEAKTLEGMRRKWHEQFS